MLKIRTFRIYRDLLKRSNTNHSAQSKHVMLGIIRMPLIPVAQWRRSKPWCHKYSPTVVHRHETNTSNSEWSPPPSVNSCFGYRKKKKTYTCNLNFPQNHMQQYSETQFSPAVSAVRFLVTTEWRVKYIRIHTDSATYALFGRTFKNENRADAQTHSHFTGVVRIPNMAWHESGRGWPELLDISFSKSRPSYRKRMWHGCLVSCRLESAIAFFMPS